MNRAIGEARSSLDGFIDRLAHPSPAQSYAGVKVPLTEGAITEHVWMSHLSFDGSRFRGVLGNDPVDLHHVKLGDTLVAVRDSISDWMLVDRDTVFGAYTVYVLRARMPSAERVAFDREQGLYFGAAPRALPK